MSGVEVLAMSGFYAFIGRSIVQTICSVYAGDEAKLGLKLCLLTL